MPIITISRGSHSLGYALAQQVATELGYPCVDREVVQEAAERLGIPQEVVRKRVDSAPSLWERSTSERKLYGAAMQSILADHAVRGDFVFDGYAGHLLFRGLHPILKVRIVAPMEVRIPLAMKAQGLDREAAAAYIARMDDDRARWTRFVYGVDWRDPALYDVVLNVGLVSADSAAEAILTLARRPEFSGPEPSPPGPRELRPRISGPAGPGPQSREPVAGGEHPCGGRRGDHGRRCPRNLHDARDRRLLRTGDPRHRARRTGGSGGAAPLPTKPHAGPLLTQIPRRKWR